MLLSSVCAVMIPLSGCGNSTTVQSSDSVLNSDSIPQSVKNLVKAIDKDDSRAFASLVSYPLERPYPLKDITSEEEMIAYYPTMVDDSLKNVISHSVPSQWSNEAWRGFTLDDGQYVWLDENLYDVTYISAAEKRERASLIKKEMESLNPSLGKGWTPVSCLKSTVNGTIYRIDSKMEGDKEIYRMAIYNPGAPLKDKPSKVLTGYKSEEGTADTPTYYFSCPDGTEVVFSPDDPGINDIGMQLIYTTPSAPHQHIAVEKAYWLNIKN